MLLLWALACHSTPACPADMVRLAGRTGDFCIHRYEATFSGKAGAADQGVHFPDGTTQGEVTSAPGQVPATYLSWYQAYAACAQAGLHLCTSAEWEDACGPGAYPTPDGSFHAGQCALSDPRHGQLLPLSKTGAWPDCHTAAGVYDLEGNVWEWTDPGEHGADGRPLVDKRGAAHYSGDPARCDQAAVGTHAPSFAGVIGFRCCTVPR